MLKQLLKIPNLLLMYTNIIIEQEAKGIIELTEPIDEHSKIHYISHHAVEVDSPTTSIHVVFVNCLLGNDCLLIGSP